MSGSIMFYVWLYLIGAVAAWPPFIIVCKSQKVPKHFAAASALLWPVYLVTTFYAYLSAGMKA